jgi:hypothetical protein
VTRAACAAAILIAALPLAAAAQTPPDAIEASAEAVQPPPAPPVNQGPMIVERLHSGFVFTPEVKATEFDEKVSGLVGGSAGWLSQETFFIGGGGYWMPTNQSNGRRLAYGGVVMQWFVVNGDRFGVSAKALLGGGRATLPETVTQVVGFPLGRDADRLTPAQQRDLIQSHTVTTTVRSRQDFLAAEPELNARLGLTRHVRLTLGAGYRFAGNDWRREGLLDRGRRISGAVGSLGVQIGG